MSEWASGRRRHVHPFPPQGPRVSRSYTTRRTATDVALTNPPTEARASTERLGSW